MHILSVKFFSQLFVLGFRIVSSRLFISVICSHRNGGLFVLGFFNILVACYFIFQDLYIVKDMRERASASSLLYSQK